MRKLAPVITAAVFLCVLAIPVFAETPKDIPENSFEEKIVKKFNKSADLIKTGLREVRETLSTNGALIAFEATDELVEGQDVGRALNPTQVEGQMQGGATQSIGLGMMEGYRYGEDGRMLNADLLDYPIPTALDVPDIQTVIVEESCSDGPYGAKGVGEPPIIPGAAAVANAVHDAVGVRVTEVPITPERVLAALRQQAGN